MNNRLKVVDFGPISSGFQGPGGMMSFPRVTVFCGPQGSGKSSIAKLYSSLTWLEKFAFRYSIEFGGMVDVDIFHEVLRWQGVDTYLTDSTEILYEGRYKRIAYCQGKLSVDPAEDFAKYAPSQIMYMPAERNFASIVKNASNVESLPRPLDAMQVAFHDAQEAVSADGYKLPANGYSFAYDKEKGDAWIVNGATGGKTNLRLASSGLQSIVPMLLTSEYLLEKVKTSIAKGVRESSSARDELMARRCIKEAKERLEKQAIDQAAYDAMLRQLSCPNQAFLNIVEEPEQNLYPETQCDVINRLLALSNALAGNQLVLSTHSPYVVNTLVSSSKTAALKKRIESGEGSPEMAEELNRIYPLVSAVPQEEMALYELTDAGVVHLLPFEGDVPSDENLLNRALGKWAERFDELLSLEVRLNG